MKVLITGGAGFLGYHTANLLHERGVECELLDIAEYVESDYPEEMVKHDCDVRHRGPLEELIKNGKYDVVMHGAAALPLWKKKDIFDTNVDGTRNVLEFSKKHGVERVIYISSTSVYGVPEKHPLFEDDPLVGVGAYGESKIMAEKICEEFRASGYCVPVLRPKSFIGRGRLGVFQILYDWVESGKKIPVIGNGRNPYQLLEVEDLVNAIYICLDASAEKVNDNFNIGATEYTTVNGDVGALCEHAGNGARVMHTPAGLVILILSILEFLKLSPLYKWIYGTAARESFVSVDKFRETTGWEPEYSNAQALIRSYDWYLENKDASDSASGVTHRVAWKQGALKIVKWFM